MSFRRLGQLLLFSLMVLLTAAPMRADVSQIVAPVYLQAQIENETVPVCLPDGTIKAFFVARPDGLVMRSVASTDGGLTWSTPIDEFPLPGPGYHAVQVIQERGGELVMAFCVHRGNTSNKFATENCYDVWVCTTLENRSKWSEPKRVFEGYVGALRGIAQLKNGRIVVPFGCEVPGRGAILPTGGEAVSTIYSDDAGKTWSVSPQRLIATCDPEYNNAGFDGACEPSIIELQDGRVWILIRTQANYQYESFSNDGVTFSPAKRSRFFSPSAPSYLLRLEDTRLVAIWNNNANPPKVNGKDVYGGRDALHIAISNDDGKTWRGFRELYLDPLRNNAPPERGDRGTSYPSAVETKEGKILVTAGLGEARRRVILLDPKWIEEREATSDFSRGIDDWSVFKWYGPIKGVWRNRMIGPELIDHPAKSGKKALFLRRADDNDADGATWNIPSGTKGEVKIRLLMRAGSEGGSISLNDRFFDPTDINGDSKAMFYTRFYPDGAYCSGTLEPDQWHDVSLKWDTVHEICEIRIDGKLVMELPQLEPTQNGVSYIRFRSTAAAIDTKGFLIESVAAKVEAP